MANGNGNTGTYAPGGGDPSAALATSKGAAQTLGQLVVAAQRQAFTVGNVYAVNNVGTTWAQAFGAPNTAIIWIVFHNPSDSIELLVGLGSISGVTFSNRGGAFLLVPGDYLPFVGNVSVNWNAIAASGSANPLTIITSSQ